MNAEKIEKLRKTIDNMFFLHCGRTVHDRLLALF